MFLTTSFNPGGHGGDNAYENGAGGWSYYNPDQVLLVLDARGDLRHMSHNRVPSTWKVRRNRDYKELSRVRKNTVHVQPVKEVTITF